MHLPCVCLFYRAGGCSLCGRIKAERPIATNLCLSAADLDIGETSLWARLFLDSLEEPAKSCYSKCLWMLPFRELLWDICSLCPLKLAINWTFFRWWSPHSAAQNKTDNLLANSERDTGRKEEGRRTLAGPFGSWKNREEDHLGFLHRFVDLPGSYPTMWLPSFC